MTAPRLVLPSEAMPWGRWADGGIKDNATAIERERADASSLGSQFKSRSDLMTRQIASINNVSTQYTVSLPDYTRSKPAGSFDGPNVMFESDPVTFTPPRPTGNYRLLLFCNMYATQTGGTSNLDYSWTYMMVNGRVYRQPALEENRIGLFTVQHFQKIASVGAWENVSDGSPTTVKIGLYLNPFDAKTVEFTNCSITAVYVGGL